MKIQKDNIIKKIRNEKGSAAVFVVVSMMFLMLILVTVFATTQNEIIEQENQIALIEEQYIKTDTELKTMYESFSNPSSVYVPEGGILSKIDTEDEIDEGLVMTLAGNQYVWIPVPCYVFKTATSKTDYANIEADIDVYTGYSQSGYEDTHPEYMNIKYEVLESIYEYNGFWVGRYEAGTETLRTSTSQTLTPVVIQKGVYPYNRVTIAQAQEQAELLGVEGKYDASVIFGFQWDLILQFMDVSSEIGVDINSTSIGNYSNTVFIISEGKYSSDSGKSYLEGLNQTKTSTNEWILTTGATIEPVPGGSDVTNNLLNIYDMAGNVGEWTLEKTPYTYYPYNARGGNYFSHGASDTIYSRYQFFDSTTSHSGIGFRIVLY